MNWLISIAIRMSTKKRSSKREIRVPAKFRDSVHALPKRNCDQNNDSWENQRHGRGEDRSNNGGKRGLQRLRVMVTKRILMVI